MLQTLIVTAIVAASSAYALWSLMPAGWRAAARRRLGRAPAAAAGCGGGCSGCASAGSGRSGQPLPAGAAATQVIRFHPRPSAAPGPGG